MLNSVKILNHQERKLSIIAYYANKTSNFIEKSSNMMDFTEHTLWCSGCTTTKIHTVLDAFISKKLAGFHCYNLCVGLSSYKGTGFRVPGQQADSSPGHALAFSFGPFFPLVVAAGTDSALLGRWTHTISSCFSWRLVDVTAIVDSHFTWSCTDYTR